MADTTQPFLDRPTFETMFRTLTAQERVLAELSLRAASLWIDARIAEAGRPELPRDDPMAILVTFEVVRDVFPAVPQMGGRTQYTVTTDDRTESGTLADVAGLLDFNERHYQLLGLSSGVGPAYGGMGGDFGDPFRAAGDPFWAGGSYGIVHLGELPG